MISSGTDTGHGQPPPQKKKIAEGQEIKDNLCVSNQPKGNPETPWFFYFFYSTQVEFQDPSGSTVFMLFGVYMYPREI